MTQYVRNRKKFRKWRKKQRLNNAAIGVALVVIAAFTYYAVKEVTAATIICALVGGGLILDL